MEKWSALRSVQFVANLSPHDYRSKMLPSLLLHNKSRTRYRLKSCQNARFQSLQILLRAIIQLQRRLPLIETLKGKNLSFDFQNKESKRTPYERSHDYGKHTEYFAGHKILARYNKTLHDPLGIQRSCLDLQWQRHSATNISKGSKQKL